jgi:hypothetical protein
MPNKPKKVPTPKHNKPPRKKTTDRGYGHLHQMLRDILLKKYPICQICNNALSEEAHHLHYGKGVTLNSYLALCSKCHREADEERREIDAVCKKIDDLCDTPPATKKQ